MCNSKAWNSRKGRSGHWISKINRLAVYLRDGFTCAYCGRDLHEVPKREVHLDHLVSRVEWKIAGLPMKELHHPRNLVTACRKCNCGRQDQIWWKYATAGAKERIRRNRERKPNRSLARAIIRGEAPMPGREV